jgi:hypothetical protein
MKDTHAEKMDTKKARLFLDEIITERGVTYAYMSRLIGKNPAYIQQFIKRGTPRRLNELDRRLIARYLGVSEHLLSGLPSWDDFPALIPQPPESVLVPRLSLDTSAGVRSAEVEERPTKGIAVDARCFREIGAQPPYVSIIRIAGESMAPTLNHGDEVMVDHCDNMTKLRDGIYVLRREGVLIVKRVAVGPQPGRFSISSDNSFYPSWADVEAELITVIGRVVWVSRIVR